MIEAELLRPASWVDSIGCRPGAVVPIWVEAMGLDRQTDAVVEAVEPCPAVADGPGRLVTGRFTHLNGQMLALRLAGEQEEG